MVTLTEVTKIYHGQSPVLDQLNLTLNQGDFLYVIGGSGAGKSTLLSLIATEETPTQGTVSLFGYDLARASTSTLRAIRRVIGYIPQSVRLIPDLSVYDNVALGAATRAQVHDVLERVGLSAKRDKMGNTLSGGEAQRVAFARALVRGPELIVADEPTGAQDRDFTWALMDLLNRVNVTGTTVIIATHDREIVRRVRKRCAVLRRGRIQLEENASCTY